MGIPAPTLSEKDARTIVRKVCHEIHALGAHATECGVHLEREGFYFAAEINGRRVWVLTSGSFNYRRVAAELISAALSVPPPPPSAPHVLQAP